MNYIELMKHISLQLHTVVKQYSKECVLVEKICMRTAFQDPLEKMDYKIKELILLYENKVIVILKLNNSQYYSIVNTKEYSYIIGPILLEIDMELKYKVEIDFHELIEDVVVIDNNIFFYNLIFLYNICSEDIVTTKELLLNNIDDVDFYNKVEENLSDYFFDRQESEYKHNSYEQEIREQTSIEQGDLASLELAFKEDLVGEIGILAKDKLRHSKNLAIVNITLACRSSIRGGLPPEEAFSMADVYTLSVEENNDIGKVLHLMQESEREYTRRVFEIKKRKKERFNSYNQRVNMCKNYIFSHLHNKIYIKDIADELGMSPNYLSELFKKYEGVSIAKYIMLEKINRTKNLLKYSDFSYIEIASYLGFCSQTHLGKEFKKVTGYTLKQYRDQFGNSAFN